MNFGEGKGSRGKGREGIEGRRGREGWGYTTKMEACTCPCL